MELIPVQSKALYFGRKIKGKYLIFELLSNAFSLKEAKEILPVLSQAYRVICINNYSALSSFFIAMNEKYTDMRNIFDILQPIVYKLNLPFNFTTPLTGKLELRTFSNIISLYYAHHQKRFIIQRINLSPDTQDDLDQQMNYLSQFTQVRELEIEIKKSDIEVFHFQLKSIKGLHTLTIKQSCIPKTIKSGEERLLFQVHTLVIKTDNITYAAACLILNGVRIIPKQKLVYNGKDLRLELFEKILNRLGYENLPLIEIVPTGDAKFGREELRQFKKLKCGKKVVRPSIIRTEHFSSKELLECLSFMTTDVKEAVKLVISTNKMQTLLELLKLPIAKKEIQVHAGYEEIMEFINAFANGTLPQLHQNTQTHEVLIPDSNCRNHEKLRALLNIIFASCTNLKSLTIEDENRSIYQSAQVPPYPEYQTTLNISLMKNRLESLTLMNVTIREHNETFNQLIEANFSTLTCVEMVACEYHLQKLMGSQSLKKFSVKNLRTYLVNNGADAAAIQSWPNLEEYYISNSSWHNQALSRLDVFNAWPKLRILKSNENYLQAMPHCYRESNCLEDIDLSNSYSQINLASIEEASRQRGFKCKLTFANNSNVAEAIINVPNVQFEFTVYKVQISEEQCNSFMFQIFGSEF
ncbi:hypothetical protein FGO68_gene5639 [Halteria grandinella]|uniref:Uncharacterized protein n=1 Tax=Halteria grandinella TaxID=5974 RepID=A0A8J8NWW2_HALGN|nr:hypothetical protein FGO68_gene5639 [Halteria grandinella]